ncbi:MAG: YqjF family protein [Candidatus Binatia bacterium]
MTEQYVHRPWPPPRKPWVLAMRWHELLFLHWPVSPQILRPLIPGELEIDTYDGSAWIGVVPFHMTRVRLRFMPGLAFAELNVRTYVKFRGKTGVWFFSLDAASKLAVRAARFLGLPYFDARMRVEPSEKTVVYRSVRIHRQASPAEFDAVYEPTGPVYYSSPGSLDRWLTARYCLYAAHRKQVVYGEIDHPPWPLQPAELDLRVNTMANPLAIALPNTKPLLHFARCLDVVAWPVGALQQ